MELRVTTTSRGAWVWMPDEEAAKQVRAVSGNRAHDAYRGGRKEPLPVNAS
jgi:hypothetical protein